MINKVSFKVQILDGNRWCDRSVNHASLDIAVCVAELDERERPERTFRVVMVTEEPIYAI